MAGRPQLAIGTWGSIHTSRSGRSYEAKARFRDSDGVTRQLRRKARTAGAARDALAQALRDRADRADDGSLTPDSTMHDLATSWLATLKLADSSITAYRHASTTYLMPRLGSLRIREATVPRLERVLTDIAQSIGSPTAKRCRNVLLGMCAYAVRQGAAEANPAASTATVAVDAKEVRALTPGAIWALRRAARGLLDARRDDDPRVELDPLWDVADFIEVGLGTGARISDILALSWDDLADGTIAITEQKKGGRRILLDAPSFMVAALLDRKARTVHGNTEGLIFPSSSGGRLDPSNFRRSWRAVTARAGVPWATPHALRKTVATELERRVSEDAASRQLGHANVSMTKKHYIERGQAGPAVRSELDAAFGISVA